MKTTHNNRAYTTDSFTLNVHNQWIWVDGYDSTTLTVGDVVNLRADVGANAGDFKNKEDLAEVVRKYNIV